MMIAALWICFVTFPSSIAFTVPHRQTRWKVQRERNLNVIGMISQGSGGGYDDDSALLLQSMVEKQDRVIQNLESQLDVTDGDLREAHQKIKVLENKVSTLSMELDEVQNQLKKRDQLIENLEEEIVEVENQLKSVGKFQEKKPPMKGRKVVRGDDEDGDWVDPLQDVQGSLFFHLGMTIRLTLLTLFFRIPKFILSIPKRFLK
jgi:hypothetical protein